MEEQDEHAFRLKRLEYLKEKGINPYPSGSGYTHTIATVRDDFDSLLKEETEVIIDGRIMSVRKHGGSMFLDLFDGTGKVQIFLKKDNIGEESFNLFEEIIDRSDFIEVTGTAFLTKKEEPTILVSKWSLLSKSLRPIPDEWYGLKDSDDRFRKRYIDILLDKEVADTVRLRSVFWNSMRNFLLEREFIEVDTPVLENTTGGADARPFVTHHNALDMDVYLRISAGELWQKQLMIAGIPRTFEIGRIFRNEGMSAEHLQDYTQLEFYQAYSDYREGMKMIKEMYVYIAKEVFGKTKFTIGEFEVELDSEWEVLDYVGLLQKEFGIDVLNTTLEEILSVLEKEKIKFDKKEMNLERGVDTLWKQLRKKIAGPAFLINVPVYLEPLAKRSEENNEVVERFQVILAGSEMGKGFSELNDPIDQRKRFEHQEALRAAGDEEAQMSDLDFVEALEHGMPPVFGFGVSERLFSFLMNKNIREAQIFPLMKPRE